MLYNDSQLSLFDDEPDVKNQSLDYITIDFETENDNSVTIRDRDTMEQVRININELEKYLDSKI